jgi:hypothetical protein
MQLFKSYYNFCRRYGTLKGMTPAQAAGLSDRCWTLRELLALNVAITSKTTWGVSSYPSRLISTTFWRKF